MPKNEVRTNHNRFVGISLKYLLFQVTKVPFETFDGRSSDKFNFPVFMGTCQSALSSLSALLYILAGRKPGQTIYQALGLEAQSSEKPKAANGTPNGAAHPNGQLPHSNIRILLLRYLQCSVFITLAAPFGFAALSYISYPMMVLGKSCKLVPVMLMNVLLYRRRFAPHKYLVVAMVTAGITMFTIFGDKGKPSKTGGAAKTASDSLVGIAYLLINLAIDGATNSTQDEVFVRHGVTGQQMMFWINLFSTVLTGFLGGFPLPYIPVLHPSTDGSSELAGALEFIRSHRGVISPLAQFAITGALGQLFIFETLQHFGSLTLV